MELKEALNQPGVDAIVETADGLYAVGPASKMKSVFDVPEPQKNWLRIHSRYSTTRLAVLTAAASPEAPAADIARMFGIDKGGLSRAIKSVQEPCPCCGTLVFKP